MTQGNAKCNARDWMEGEKQHSYKVQNQMTKRAKEVKKSFGAKIVSVRKFPKFEIPGITWFPAHFTLHHTDIEFHGSSFAEFKRHTANKAKSEADAGEVSELLNTDNRECGFLYKRGDSAVLITTYMSKLTASTAMLVELYAFAESAGCKFACIEFPHVGLRYVRDMESLMFEENKILAKWEEKAGYKFASWRKLSNVEYKKLINRPTRFEGLTGEELKTKLSVDGRTKEGRLLK